MLELEKDLARQTLLQRVGLTFHRIRGGKYFRNPDLEFQRLVDHLIAMGIEPAGEQSSQQPDETDAIKRRVVARAREIREELSSTRDFDYYRRQRRAGTIVSSLGSSIMQDDFVSHSAQTKSQAEPERREAIAESAAPLLIRPKPPPLQYRLVPLTSRRHYREVRSHSTFLFSLRPSDRSAASIWILTHLSRRQTNGEKWILMGRRRRVPSSILRGTEARGNTIRLR